MKSSPFCGFLLLAVLAPVAAASEPAFPRRTCVLSLTTAYATPILGDDERYFTLTGAAGYYFLDDLSLNLGLAVHGIDSWSGASGVAGETNLLFRWHFWQHERWTAFADGGCGFLYSDHELPADGHGTHWNFTPQAGLGATYRLKENTHLIFGTRWFHASNGGLQGGDRHPGSNALMGYVGLLWLR